MKAKKIVSLVLAACLVWEGAAFAASAAPKEQREIKVVVLELRSPESESVLTQTMVNKVREELKREGTWQVLSVRGNTTTSSLKKTVEKAWGDYSRLEFDEAKKSLQQGLDQLRRDGMTHDDTLSLIPAKILLGVICHVSGDTDGAKKAFEEVVRLDPQTMLNEKKYSPQVRQLFAEVKGAMQGKNKELGQLKVTSRSGKVKVYLNGIPKGETPLQIKGIYPGRQIVSLAQEGREAFVQRVDVSSGKTTKIDGNLPEERSPPGEFPSITVSESQRSEEVVSRSAVIGRDLGADRVILVGAKMSGNTKEVTAQMVDVPSRRFLTAKTVELSSEIEGADLGAKLLAAHLMVEGDLEKIGGPRLGLAQKGDKKVVARRSRSRKAVSGSFWKKPVVWIVAGALVAGGGASAGILMTRGGDSSPVPGDITISIGGGKPAGLR